MGQEKVDLVSALYEKEADTSLQGPACILKSSTLLTLFGFYLYNLELVLLAGVLVKSEGECWIS